MSVRSERIRLEVWLLAMAFGEANYDDTGFDWVELPHFTLPSDWNRKSTQLLIELPKSYPQVGPDGFYMDKKLRDRRGRTPDHYFEEQGRYNKYGHLGWAWFCLHQQPAHEGGWRATSDVLEGDSLINYVELIRAILSDKGR